MKNYYSAMNVTRDANPQALVQRLNELESTRPEIVAGATSILLTEARRKNYNLLHAQYESLTQVCQNIGRENLLDTNNWAGRLQQFNSSES